MTTSGVFTEKWPVEKGGAYHSCTTTALHCRKEFGGVPEVHDKKRFLV